VAPYPQHLETIEKTRDGALIALRPVRPEDDKLLQDLFAHMSRQDVRLRFFAAIRELSQALVARFSQIDYDREMALIAQQDGTTLGVARYFAEADRTSAEFAIAVRSDWKGHGVGYVLMTRLIEVARGAGIGEFVGKALAENRPMLDMCRELGFSRARDPGDATVMIVRKKLAGD
jgi:acetyltransferase